MRAKLWIFKKNSGEQGSVLIFVAVSIFVLIGFAAFAIDLGHLHVVRNELQNAADTVALAGASALYRNTTSLDPNFSQAQAAATNSINLNRSDGITLVDCQVETGYWNLSQNPYGLQSALPGGVILGGLWVPAVRASVSRATGQNSGSVIMWFASVLGINSVSSSAQAVAVVAYPGSVGPGNLVPFVMSGWAYDNYGPNSPNHDTPFELDSPNPPSDPNNMAGEWTTFTHDAQSNSLIMELIEHGNDTTIHTQSSGNCQSDPDSCTWIVTGVRDRNYQMVRDLYTGSTILLPVVQGPIQDGLHSDQPVIGFAAFHITQVLARGANSYIEGYIVSNFQVGSTAGPGGPNLGAHLPPKLVQ